MYDRAERERQLEDFTHDAPAHEWHGGADHEVTQLPVRTADMLRILHNLDHICGVDKRARVETASEIGYEAPAATHADGHERTHHATARLRKSHGASAASRKQVGANIHSRRRQRDETSDLAHPALAADRSDADIVRAQYQMLVASARAGLLTTPAAVETLIQFDRDRHGGHMSPTGVELLATMTMVIENPEMAFVGGHAPAAAQTKPVAEPENADKRELQVATRRSRAHEAGVTLSDNASYSDMLAAVIAAANLTEHDRDRPHARRLLATVQARLHELKPVADDKLKGYGFGNAGGHAIFDSASGAIDSWIRKIDLNSSIATDAFVNAFRVGAETIRICTGERADAPNLRAVDRAGRQTAVVAAATTLAPGVLALAVEEAALLGFIARTSGQRLSLWAITHPAAALVASEALIGFGVQIGQDGWGGFVDGLSTPQGALFVATQIAMDFMHVQMARTPMGAADSSAELDGLRSRYAQARAVLDQATHEAGTAPQLRSSVSNAPDATTHMNTSEVQVARYKPTTVYDPWMPSDRLGETDKYGNIRIRPGMSPTDEALTLAHEQVHSALSPKVALLREFRANVGAAGYERSAFLKYTEEALAESIANIRVKGFSIPAVVEGLKFPVTHGYVTFSRLATETAIGTIVYAGIVYAVYLETSPSDHSDQKGGQP